MDINPIYEKAQRASSDAVAAYERIRSDTSLSPEGKREQYAVAHAQAQAELTALRDRVLDRRRQEHRRALDDAFGLPKLESDRAAFRTLAAQAESLTNRDGRTAEDQAIEMLH